MWGGSASCWGKAHKICTCAAVPAERHPVRLTRGTRGLRRAGAEITHTFLSLCLTHIRTIVPQSRRQQHAVPHGKSTRISSVVSSASVQQPLKDDQEEQEVGRTKLEAALGNNEAIKARTAAREGSEVGTCGGARHRYSIFPDEGSRAEKQKNKK